MKVLNYVVLSGSHVLAWLIASECYSARIFTVPLNIQSPANEKLCNAIIFAQGQVDFAISVFGGGFETNTAHKT